MSGDGSGARWRWIVALLVPTLAIGPLAAIAPHIPLGEGFGAVLLAYLFAFSCVSAAMLGAADRLPRWRKRDAAFAVGGGVALLGAVALFGPSMPRWLEAATVTLALLAAGSALGGLVGRQIEDTGHLGVVAVVSALIDIYSVFHPRGPTAQVVASEQAISLLVVPWPLLGTPRIEPVLGVGDAVFIALYTAAATRHGLGRRRTLVALAIGLALTMGIVALTGEGIPALPLLGAAFVVAHPEARRLRREDRLKAAVGIVGLALLVGLLFGLG